MRWNKERRFLEECGPCPVFAGFTLAYVLQMKKRLGKNLSQGARKQDEDT
jgi:hypothetical protein